MKRIGKILLSISMITLLFGCKKKTYKDNTTTTKKDNTKIVTNNTTTKSNTTTNKNDSNLYHYKFVNYDGSVLYEGDMTKGWTVANSLIPNPSRASEGQYYYYFTGWSPEVNSITNNDVTYTAQYEKLKKPYEKTDERVYFGYYPQTLENDSSTKTNLNATAGLPSTNDDWVSYGYYDDNLQSNYMWYIDLDTNNDGRFDYRGVYFTKYRPNRITKYATTDNSNVDDNGFTAEEIYWFKYEKVEWIVLEYIDGNMFMMANLVIDSQEFYPGHSNTPFAHNGSTDYVNDYKLSEIRKWLNDEFYNTAFSDTEQKAIITKEYKTRQYRQSSSSSNSYCKDNISILSEEELLNYSSSNSDRYCEATDYAKIQGVGLNGDSACWGLRTPANYSSISDYATYRQYVDYNGYVSNLSTDFSNIGIRPCILVVA